jgi:hypothetical protein
VIEATTFIVSIAALASIRSLGAPADAPSPSLASVVEGMKYALGREELIGTYVVDIVAMIFGMPMALFPALAEAHGGASVLGWYYAAPAVGALVATLSSGWCARVERHGAAVVLAAGAWGVAITGLGFCTWSLALSLACLAAAGAADMVSGIFRGTIWNETIPDRLRGRLAGVEMVSYLSGPLLGNVESGLVAAEWSVVASVLSGGVLCVIGVALSVVWLPGFWRYDASKLKN